MCLRKGKFWHIHVCFSFDSSPYVWGSENIPETCCDSCRKAHVEEVMMKSGGHLGFQGCIDCCWSVQLEIDFGLSVGRHCQCEAAQQQQPIFSPLISDNCDQSRLLQISQSVFLPNCHSAVTKKCQSGGPVSDTQRSFKIADYIQA